MTCYAACAWQGSRLPSPALTWWKSPRRSTATVKAPAGPPSRSGIFSSVWQSGQDSEDRVCPARQLAVVALNRVSALSKMLQGGFFCTSLVPPIARPHFPLRGALASEHIHGQRLEHILSQRSCVTCQWYRSCSKGGGLST